VSVALAIQHAKRIRRIILSTVICLAVPYFLLYLNNGTIFGKKWLNIKCVFWFSLQLLSETCLILRRNQRVIILIVILIVHFFPCGRTDRRTWQGEYSLFTVLQTDLQTYWNTAENNCEFAWCMDNNEIRHGNYNINFNINLKLAFMALLTISLAFHKFVSVNGLWWM